MDIIRAYASNNLCYIAAQKMTPKGIVVHSTGANNPMLKRYVNAPDEVGVNLRKNYWDIPKPEGKNMCVHAFIGYDRNNQVRVAELLPLDICCWGVGKGKKGSYNSNPAYIQFEICEDNLHDIVYYEKAFGVAAEYCAYLSKRFKLSVDSIVSHKEAHERGYGSNHRDPDHWMKNFGETMDDFRRKVSCIINNDGSICSDKENADTSRKIHDGDLVSIADNAVYYNGKAVPDWVKSLRWYVMGNPNGDRAVIDINESHTKSVKSPISVKYLTAEKQGIKK